VYSNKLTFIAWSPDDASIQVRTVFSNRCHHFFLVLTHFPQAKMIYASSKEALKRTLTGIATELQANDADDIEYDSIIKTVSKGLA